MGGRSKMEIVVIDDIIDTKYQEGIKNILLGDGVWNGKVFPWFYTEDVTGADEPDSQHRAALGHEYVFFDDDDTGRVISDFHSMFIPMLKDVMYRIGLKTEETDILQGRSFLQLPRNIQREDVDTPHIDIIRKKHLVALYYVCDSDGDTVIYNEKDECLDGNYTIKQKVTPKQGRIVLFDGGLFHAAEQPINSNTRCIVNYNLAI